ncbi:DoxX family protein [Sphingomonas sp.]|uniref:DoxX family protein n=1 Tax=Sphingomonas sp. TaxID=28214 RepID=UPI001B0591BB|nr:DoxX family protein [Sphingomonas sp.]MBO9711983.1 DoxX family protein [Sphingomonas sp.]
MPIPPSWSGVLLSLLRIAAGLTFMEHGTSKLWHFPKALGSPDALTLPLGLLETIGGAMLVAGLLTRPLAFLLSGEMAVAYWWVHAQAGPYPLANGGEGAVLFCFIFLYLAAAGGGSWSLDALLARKRA